MSQEITKNQIKEMVFYHFSPGHLREFIREESDPDFKGGKRAMADFLGENFDADDLLELVSNRLRYTKHHHYVFETDGNFRVDEIDQQLRNDLNLDFSEESKVILWGVNDEEEHSEKYEYGDKKFTVTEDRVGIVGLVEASLKAYKYDRDSEENISERRRTYRFIVPFKVVFAEPNLVRVHIMKFAPSRIHPLRFPEEKFLNIDSMHMDSLEIANHLVGAFIAKGIVGAADHVNVTTALRKLVEGKTLSSIHVRCEDAQEMGFHSRTKNECDTGSNFVEYDWYGTHEFYDSTNITPGVWFWTEGLNLDQALKDYDRLSIDPTNGIFGQNARTKTSLKYIVDRLIEEND